MLLIFALFFLYSVQLSIYFCLKVVQKRIGIRERVREGERASVFIVFWVILNGFSRREREREREKENNLMPIFLLDSICSQLYFNHSNIFSLKNQFNNRASEREREKDQQIKNKRIFFYFWLKIFKSIV